VSIAEAFELLDLPGAVVLAGGTQLNGHPADEPVAAVDLQALDLDRITPEAGDSMRIGAMTTLQRLVEHNEVPEVVREAARREQPSTIRAQATIGGCIATGQPESELLGALLVHEAVVHVGTRGATESIHLDELLAGLPLGAGRVVTSVTIRTSGNAAAARTARTPADRAIVAAFARTTEGGRRVALTGVARTPVLVEPDGERGDELQPIGDFRGSSEYRRVLADVLLARVMEGIP
jgi:probable selenate reductase FAD-binding subunit